MSRPKPCVHPETLEAIQYLLELAKTHSLIKRYNRRHDEWSEWCVDPTCRGSRRSGDNDEVKHDASCQLDAQIAKSGGFPRHRDTSSR